MLVGCVVEGETEYYCVPPMLSRLGHAVLRPLIIKGSSGDWDQVIRVKVIPRVKALALKNPAKILVILDREDRAECPPELAAQALLSAQRELEGAQVSCPVAFIVVDRYFECMLFADYDALDRLPIIERPVSPLLGERTDGLNVLSIIRQVLRHGSAYHKTEHGPRLASQIRLEHEPTQRRNRALRKFIKEAPPDYPAGCLFENPL